MACFPASWTRDLALTFHTRPCKLCSWPCSQLISCPVQFGPRFSASKWRTVPHFLWYSLCSAKSGKLVYHSTFPGPWLEGGSYINHSKCWGAPPTFPFHDWGVPCSSCHIGLWKFTDESFFRDTFGQGDCTPQLRTTLKCHPNPRVSHRLNCDLCATESKINFLLFPFLLLLLSYRCYSQAISIKLSAQKSLSLSLFPVKSNPGQQQSEHWISTNVEIFKWTIYSV